MPSWRPTVRTIQSRPSRPSVSSQALAKEVDLVRGRTRSHRSMKRAPSPMRPPRQGVNTSFVGGVLRPPRKRDLASTTLSGSTPSTKWERGPWRPSAVSSSQEAIWSDAVGDASKCPSMRTPSTSIQALMLPPGIVATPHCIPRAHKSRRTSSNPSRHCMVVSFPRGNAPQIGTFRERTPSDREKSVWPRAIVGPPLACPA